MEELYGWMGKILRVNLTNGQISTIDTEKYVPKYIGGMGIAHRIAWEEIPPGTGAFDPDNKLIMMTGPLTGTPAPASGRAELGYISAQGIPEQYIHSGLGGRFPAEIKYAGFDGIIIEGAARSPCYLWIHDGEAELKDAGSLWGLDTYETQHELKKIHGELVHTLCIGQAGENRSRIAVMLTDSENAFGQGGSGGIAGAKNLKAICAKGTKKVKIARPEELLKIRAQLADPPTKNPLMVGNCVSSHFKWRMPRGQWCRKACSLSCAKICFHGYGFRDVPRVTRSGLHSGQIKCVGHWFAEWELERGYRANSPIWPLWSQGFEGGLEALELANRYGLNEWELLAGMVPWLVMGNRMGVITEDLFGGSINPNDPEWWARFLHMVAYREGFGDLLAEGTTRAINALGKDKFGETIYTGTRLCGLHELGEETEFKQINTPISLQEAMGYAEHMSGRGIHSFREFPAWLLRALCWLIESRDPLNKQHIKASDKWLAEFEKDPYIGKIGPAISFFNVIRAEVKGSLPLCDYDFPRPDGPYPMKSGGNSDGEARLFSAVTGIDISEEELDKAGLRLRNLYRAIQVRNQDRNRRMEWNELLPFFRRPDGTTGAAINEEKFAVMVDNFYELFGWDKATGRPTRETLESLELKDVADGLSKIGSLSRNRASGIPPANQQR